MTSHASGKHGDHKQHTPGTDPSTTGLSSPREGAGKQLERHANDLPITSEEQRRFIDWVTSSTTHPNLYYDMSVLPDRSRPDQTLPIPGLVYHSDCFPTSSAAHEATAAAAAAAARHDSMLRTALMGSAHRSSSGAAAAHSPSEPFLATSHTTTSIPSTHTPTTTSSKKATTSVANSGDGSVLQGRGTPGIKPSDGRCPPIGIAVAQQRQEGESTGLQGRVPPRASSRSSSASPHVPRVVQSAESGDGDDDRPGRSRESGRTSHCRSGEKEQRSFRDQSPRESRSATDIPVHLGVHRRYPHDLSANLVVTGGGTLGRPDTSMHPHLPATPHHWLPRPPSHANATPSPLWSYGLPSSPMPGGSLETSPRTTPFPMGPGGMHWAQDPTTGQLMLVPPHPSHADAPLPNLGVWPRYLVPPHLQPHSHQLQQLMLNQFPYGPLPAPGHPSQHPALLQHIPGTGGSVDVQTILQQQHEALANIYRQAEQQERHRKEQPSGKQSSGVGESSKMASDSVKGASSHHRSRRESGDVKGESRPESRQSDRSRTSSQEPIEMKHSIHHSQPYLQAIPVAPSQHHGLPFMYPPPPVPYLYDNPPSSGQPTATSRSSQDSKDKKDTNGESRTSLPHVSSTRSHKDKKESALKSTSVQTSPAETPPAQMAKAETVSESETESESCKKSAKVSRTQQTDVNQQKCVSEPTVDVVTIDASDLPQNLSCSVASDVDNATTKTETETQCQTTEACEQSKTHSIQTEANAEEVCGKEKMCKESVTCDLEESCTQTQKAVPQESQTTMSPRTLEVIEATSVVLRENMDNSPTTSAAASPTPTTTAATSSVEQSTCLPELSKPTPVTVGHESLISNVMTTMQSFASTVDGLDQDQLAAIEGIALLSEVAEHKANVSRAEFWNCVAEQQSAEMISMDQPDSPEPAPAEAPLKGNSVSAVASSAGCDLSDAIPGLTPGELSLKIRCPITIKKEANGRSEVSACGAPLGATEGMNPMELEMRMKLAELQRKYKEKKRELDKLQKKKDKKVKEESKNNNPTVEKRRGRGRPRKRKFSQKSSTETTDTNSKEKEVKTLHSSATVLLEAAASLEEPVPKKKKKKEHKTKKEHSTKEKSTKQTKKSKKLKSKVDTDNDPSHLNSDTKTHTKKKKTQQQSIQSTELSGQLLGIKQKASKSSKKRLESPLSSESPPKKQWLSKSASKKLQMANLANQESLTSDTDSGSIIWPNKTVPSSPSASTTKPVKSPKLKTKVSKKLKLKDGKVGTTAGRKKKNKDKDASKSITTDTSSTGLNRKDGTLPSLQSSLTLDNIPKHGLSIAHVYGEDSDSPLEEVPTTTTSVQNNWNSHKGLALLAELSSTQPSSRSATPTKTKKKKNKDKTKVPAVASSSPSPMRSAGTNTMTAKKMSKLMKKRLSPSRRENAPAPKKVKRPSSSKSEKDTESQNMSSKTEKVRKEKPMSVSQTETEQQGTQETPTPQFDERSWCRRRSERIFLSDVSPVQSRDVSPLCKPDATKKRMLRSPNKPKTESTKTAGAVSGSGGQTIVVNQIGSVLDALKTDPLQMRKKLHRLSAQEEDDEDEDSGVPDENRRKKLKKKSKKKKTPSQDKLMAMDISAIAGGFDSSDSDGENVPLSSLVDRPSTPAPRSCVISVEELQDGLRVLIPIEGLFYAGNVRAIQPPDVYGVVVEGGRGSRPHVFSQEQILQEAIADVKPSSSRYLPEGTRVCAYWSQQYRCLYPGTVVKGSPTPTFDSKFVSVEFDDGDSGRIPLDHIRMLPQDYPVMDLEPSPIMLQRKRRRRPSETSSTTEWKMDLIKAGQGGDEDLDAEERQAGKHKDYSWKDQSSKDDMQAISEDCGDNDVFLPNPKVKKTTSGRKSLVKGLRTTKKTKGKLKLKVKDKLSKGVHRDKNRLPTSSPNSHAIVSPKAKLGKLTKLKKKKGISSSSSSPKFGHKILKKRDPMFAVKSRKKGKVSADGKGNGGKRKGTAKKKHGARCTVEIETVYSSEVFPDELGYHDGMGNLLSNSYVNSDDSSLTDESDTYNKNSDVTRKKTKKKKKRRNKDDLELSSSSTVSAFSPPRLLWRWLGKATQRRGSKGKARKLFYRSIVREKEIIRVGECAVFLSTGRPHLPYIGRIESMWESWGGNMVVRVKWFYHPEETKGGRKANDGKMALYLSQHVDENDVQTISHKCEVFSLEEYKLHVTGKKIRNTFVGPQDIYYLAGTYDPGSGHTVCAT